MPLKCRFDFYSDVVRHASSGSPHYLGLPLWSDDDYKRVRQTDIAMNGVYEVFPR